MLAMKIIPTALNDAVIIEPQVYGDSRGFFFESFNEQVFAEKVNTQVRFVQDNHSLSHQGVLRGLHYQIQHPQGKLVRVVTGAVLDVAVDLRRHSSSFGQWASCWLTATNKRQFWVPPGFGHGFLVFSPRAEFLYKTTDFYYPAGERTISWDDPDLAIDWQLELLPIPPILSAKDQQGLSFREAEMFS